MALNGAEADDFSWEPPTEAETKVLQARRERQDRISRLMGDYLLRGYRMLGETCSDCGACTQTALLQKLTWASSELGSSASLETSIQLCGLIRACAEAMHSLQQLQH
ncbi:Sjoegren syndrome/scleroderma autoantigen 1 [Carlito syrichta]|uniref:Sjoegren syndrome/scleroderma autoantigen 1 n=1 Tax=Carlito syrichta TaxID=1868482 RepID=A0A1U7T882_CARSF|nr:Sjoegren syndrome/scleroderma autoantigen 1 [Carlito syrichta]